MKKRIHPTDTNQSQNVFGFAHLSLSPRIFFINPLNLPPKATVAIAGAIHESKVKWRPLPCVATSCSSPPSSRPPSPSSPPALSPSPLPTTPSSDASLCPLYLNGSVWARRPRGWFRCRFQRHNFFFFIVEPAVWTTNSAVLNRLNWNWTINSDQ